jgi:hypothetical protein
VQHTLYLPHRPSSSSHTRRPPPPLLSLPCTQLLVAGIIDLIPFSFGIGGIITYSKCPPDHPGKANWKKFALLQTLTLIFLFWTGLPFMLRE